MPNSSVAVSVVFVHGIFSNAATWEPFLNLLKSDLLMKDAFHFDCFEYSSPKIRCNPLQRVPDVEAIASALDTWVKQKFHESPRIVLVGHSQGGLVIQRYLSMLLDDGQRLDELSRIRAVIMFATPNTGSELFLSVRRGLEWLWSHPQEKGLKPFDEAVEKSRRIVYERSVLAKIPSNHSYPIRFFVYAGESDGIVAPQSAKWMFPQAGTLPGDHSTILRPQSENDTRYLTLVSALRWARHSYPRDGLLIETMALDLTKQEDVEGVMEIKNQRFLPEQGIRRADLKHWLQNYQEHWKFRLSVLVAKVNGVVNGFLMYHESENLIIVDYIATKKHCAYSTILSGRMLEQIQRRATSIDAPIVFEVKYPDGSERPDEDSARIALFQHMGARVIQNVSYLAPSMETLQTADEKKYLLMYLRVGAMPQSLPGSQVKMYVRQIYTDWYKNWFSHYERAKEHSAYLENLADRVSSSIPDSCPLTSWTKSRKV